MVAFSSWERFHRRRAPPSEVWLLLKGTMGRLPFQVNSSAEGAFIGIGRNKKEVSLGLALVDGNCMCCTVASSTRRSSNRSEPWDLRNEAWHSAQVGAAALVSEIDDRSIVVCRTCCQRGDCLDGFVVVVFCEKKTARRQPAYLSVVVHGASMSSDRVSASTETRHTGFGIEGLISYRFLRTVPCRAYQ